MPNVVCLHEEDYGVLWKHTDFRAGVTEVRRSRRLVVSYIATVGNYDYGFYWYFYQDGTLEYQVKMTGVISNGATLPANGRSGACSWRRKCTDRFTSTFSTSVST